MPDRPNRVYWDAAKIKEEFVRKLFWGGCISKLRFPFTRPLNPRQGKAHRSELLKYTLWDEPPHFKNNFAYTEPKKSLISGLTISGDTPDNL